MFKKIEKELPFVLNLFDGENNSDSPMGGDPQRNTQEPKNGDQNSQDQGQQDQNTDNAKDDKTIFNKGFGSGAEAGRKQATEQLFAEMAQYGLTPDNFKDKLSQYQEIEKKNVEFQQKQQTQKSESDLKLEVAQKTIEDLTAKISNLQNGYQEDLNKININTAIKDALGDFKVNNSKQVIKLFKEEHDFKNENGEINIITKKQTDAYHSNGDKKTMSELLGDWLNKPENMHHLKSTMSRGSGFSGSEELQTENGKIVVNTKEQFLKQQDKIREAMAKDPSSVVFAPGYMNN